MSLFGRKPEKKKSIKKPKKTGFSSQSRKEKQRRETDIRERGKGKVKNHQ